MAIKTKPFKNTDPGIPQVTRTVGCLIPLLDAVLVDGYGAVSVDSIDVDGTVGTLNIAGGHSLISGQVCEVSGSAVSGLNGQFRVTETAGAWVKFQVTGVATGNYTGTVSVKVAGAGWIKAFSGTNLAAYRSADVGASGFYLRVDDTDTINARIVGYERMTDINTGVNPFPTNTQIAGGLFWPKSHASYAGNRRFRIVADSRSFYWMIQSHPSYDGEQMYFFGDVVSAKTNDAYSCIITGAVDAAAASQDNVRAEWMHYGNPYPFQNQGTYIARSANGIGGSKQMWRGQAVTRGTQTGDVLSGYTTGATGYPYPSAINNGLALCNYVLFSNEGDRGTFPGLYGSPQKTNTAFSTGDVIDGNFNLTGQKVVAIKCAWSGSSAMLFLNETADWR